MHMHHNSFSYVSEVDARMENLNHTKANNNTHFSEKKKYNNHYPRIMSNIIYEKQKLYHPNLIIRSVTTVNKANDNHIKIYEPQNNTVTCLGD